MAAMQTEVKVIAALVNKLLAVQPSPKDAPDHV